MGQTSSSGGGVKCHLETAQKTGALVLSNRKLNVNEVPDLEPLSKVLRTLDLSNNKLSSLPSSVSLLSSLKHLHASNNKLTKLPEDIGKLNKLESALLMSNQLSFLPESFSKLKNLKSVILSCNNLQEFPLALCGLGQLDVVDLSGNQITSIPPQIGELQAVELNLNQNQVSRIDAAIAFCPRLKTLRLEENCLSISSFPTELFTYSQVSLLCVQGNLFKAKELEDLEGYSVYMERYTAVKKKLY